MDYIHMTERLHVGHTPDPPASSRSSSSGEDGPSFGLQFAAFARFGDAKSQGRAITLSNTEKWLRQAGVVDGLRVTTTDTAICYKQVAKTKRTLVPREFEKFLENLALQKKLDLHEVKKKLTLCGLPRTTRTTTP
ncbi:TPPP [Cordylochernes scorpioides]|uniref:TPPP n=1 Tax=Cordylochernes scorpioides TaxID=51811 RepID=A0ABY6KFT6_9ARAC|nr:TPPP [Cordylochernes scorpioides]